MHTSVKWGFRDGRTPVMTPVREMADLFHGRFAWIGKACAASHRGYPTRLA
jgi:hypothetical protein